MVETSSGNLFIALKRGKYTCMPYGYYRELWACEVDWLKAKQMEDNIPFLS